MARITTTAGDIIDQICHRHYGRTDGVTEAVYNANPHLSHHGPVLPAGIIITLPDIPAAPVTKSTRKLWS
ncbi:MAG: tail protein X [Pseudomonadota bacterium]